MRGFELPTRFDPLLGGVGGLLRYMAWAIGRATVDRPAVFATLRSLAITAPATPPPSARAITLRLGGFACGGDFAHIDRDWLAAVLDWLQGTGLAFGLRHDATTAPTTSATTTATAPAPRGLGFFLTTGDCWRGIVAVKRFGFITGTQIVGLTLGRLKGFGFHRGRMFRAVFVVARSGVLTAFKAGTTLTPPPPAAVLALFFRFGASGLRFTIFRGFRLGAFVLDGNIVLDRGHGGQVGGHRVDRA